MESASYLQQPITILEDTKHLQLIQLPAICWEQKHDNERNNVISRASYTSVLLKQNGEKWQKKGREKVEEYKFNKKVVLAIRAPLAE